MSARFIELINLRERLNDFSNEELLEFLVFVVTQGHGDVIIKGLFRQFYAEGQNSELNSGAFHSQLLNKCESIHPKSFESSNVDLNPFTIIPDSLLSRIASYIPQKQIFLCWSHVNRRFIQATSKPEVLQSVNIDSRRGYFCAQHASIPQPKFDLNLSPINLTCIGGYDRFHEMRFLVNKICLKSLIKLEIGM